MGRFKANAGNMTPGSRDSRWGTREEYKTAAKRVRRLEAQQATKGYKNSGLCKNCKAAIPPPGIMCLECGCVDFLTY